MTKAQDDNLSEDQRKALIEIIKADPSYRLAFNDEELLMKDELRPLRLQLEFLKPELYLRYHNIKSTIVLFGSTRIFPPAEAQKQLDELLLKHSDRTAGDNFDQ